jgi:predicted ferric reductase
VTVVGTSIYLVSSKLKYEWWYGIHLVTYIAITLAFFHQVTSGSDLLANRIFLYYWYALYIFVFGNLLLFRFLRQGYLFMKYRFIVDRVVPEADNAFSVYITGREISRFSIKPGQFLIARFLDNKRWWQAHPFSLSFVPKDNCLRLTVKNVGDFTAEVSQIKKGTPVLIDGPLGTFTMEQSTNDKFLFIAGGVGITPIRALIEEIGSHGKNMILLYSNKTTDIIFKQELDSLSEEYGFALHYIVTEDPSFNGETGRVDAEKIQRLVPDVLSRDVYLCGPAPMMGALVHILRGLGLKKSELHYEKFSL